MSFGALLSLVAGLALVLGIVALLLWVLKGLGPGFLTNRGGPFLAVVSRLSLSQKQGVAVVRFQGRLLLLSYGEGGVRLLSQEGEEASSSRLQGGPGEWEVEGGAAAAGPLREGVGRPKRRPLPEPSFPSIWARVRKAAGVGALSLLLLLSPGVQGELAGQVPSGGEPTREAPVAQEPGEAPLDPGAALLGLAQQLPTMDLRIGEEDGLALSGPVGAVLFLGFLTLLPTLLLMMTGFTRILVVLHLLKQAIGTQTAPPAHLLTAMALLLTGFVMAPTLSEVNQTALTPWLEGKMDEVQMIKTASGPFRGFMLGAVREEDLGTFLEMHGGMPPATVEEIPLVVVTAAFVTSELRHAFQIGFALFLPFVVIDIVVASVLMSMGMFMLPPVMVSLPFKLLLFVLVDGWSLVVQGLVRSFA